MWVEFYFLNTTSFEYHSNDTDLLILIYKVRSTANNISLCILSSIAQKIVNYRFEGVTVSIKHEQSEIQTSYFLSGNYERNSKILKHLKYFKPKTCTNPDLYLQKKKKKKPQYEWMCSMYVWILSVLINFIAVWWYSLSQKNVQFTVLWKKAKNFLIFTRGYWWIFFLSAWSHLCMWQEKFPRSCFCSPLAIFNSYTNHLEAVLYCSSTQKVLLMLVPGEN